MSRATTRGYDNGFNLSSIVQLTFIPAMTAIVVLIGFYFTTSSTLTRYGEDIKTLKGVVDSKVEADIAARNKIREDFLATQLKTADGIAKLDTRLAVAETNQKTQLDTLNRISETLSKISSQTVGLGSNSGGRR